MAHNVEPMDIDNIEGDFDNKENSFHHSNVLPRTPCTEKGYEELDVSELNMKLRYSITPASSPMSKSYTAHCLDTRNSECPDNSIENVNLTRSFNSMLTKNDNISKSSKLQPLQIHTTAQSLDKNRNSSVLRPLDSTITDDSNNITVTVTEALNMDENLSLPSSSSSALHTPEATTPTKEIPKSDGGSPIMRGLKSVLNMFRPSQSPIPPAENEDNIIQHDIGSPVDGILASSISSDVAQVALASTPIAARYKRKSSSKRGSPHKESIVFNEDLEKELDWKDETTILFSEEKIPIHKLFFQQSKNIAPQVKELDKVSTAPAEFNEIVEFMDVSYNDSVVKNKTITELTDVSTVGESDSEFVDCETTITIDNEKLTESDKENTATFLSDISRASVNKTTQEMQMSANNKESDKTYITEEKPLTVTQDILEMSGQNIEEINDVIIPTELNLTQETESKLCAETPNESLGEGTFTMELQSGKSPLISSTLNVTQDNKTQKDILQPLHATVIIDKEDKSVFSSPAVQNIGENTHIQDIKPLDATVSIESSDKPISVSTFIMNSTQNITQFSNSINEPLNTTATVEDKSMPALILSTENKSIQFNITHELDDKPISSSTFAMDATQIVHSQPETVNECINTTVTLTSDDSELVPTGENNFTEVIDDDSNQLKNPLDATVSIAFCDKTAQSSSTLVLNAIQDGEASLPFNKNDKLLDATVTVDSTEKPATSSTFIKYITQDIESHMSKDNMQTSLDTEQLLDSENKPVSSTFVNDISQDPGIELSDITITKESMQILTSSTITKGLTHDIYSEVAVRQNNNVLNSIETNKETCTTLENLNKNLSTDKSVTLSEESECKNQEIVNHQVINDDVESVSDVTLNNGPVEESTRTDENLRIHINLVPDTQSHNDDICKPTDVALPVAVEKAVIPEQYTLKENSQCEFDRTDILPKELVDYEEKQIVTDQVIPKEISPEYSIKEIESMNPGILQSFGDADKLLMTTRKVLEFNNSGKVVETLEDKGCGENLPVGIPLPDEDDIEFELSTVQHASESNAANSSVLPDVINDLESSKILDAKRIDEVPINTTDHIKAPAGLITDTLNIKAVGLMYDYKTNAENNDANSLEIMNSEQVEKNILPVNAFNSGKPIENNSINIEGITVDQPESLDISYDNHDISIRKDSVVEVNHNITTVCGSNLPEMHAQSQSPDKIKINMSSGTSTNTEQILEPSQDQYKSENDMEIKKETVLEEMVVSENNSPYVLVSVDKDVDNKNDSSILEEDFEKIENPFANKSKISPSPPTSPPIASKGYNFNFDEIDDPFATKTKIRTSPSLDSLNQINKSGEKIEIPKKDSFKNKRKSYPVRAKPAVTKKNFNCSFNGSLSTQCTKGKNNSKILNKNYLDDNDVSDLNNPKEVTENLNVLHENIENTELNVIEKSELEYNIDNASKSIDSSEKQNEEKHLKVILSDVSTDSEGANTENKSPLASTAPSSSDQSIYLSAATSSGESVTVNNAFNLPEINDMHFNAFATKSKIRLSPTVEMGVPSLTEAEFDSQRTTENANDNHAVDTSHNFSQQNKSGNSEEDYFNANNTTCSSKDDKDTTVREVHTDDEDTIEGPFLDTDDNEMTEMGLHNEIKNKELVGFDLQNDMMGFSPLPAQDAEDNELFIDAAAYEFLLNQNKSNVVMDSGKESLFLKFDPLFAKRLSSEGIAAALSKIQKRQNTPIKKSKLPPIASTDQAIAGPSTSKISPQELDTTEDIVEDINITTSKPMMVVTPAVNPIVKPRKSTTPTSSNRRSITFTSPAIAVIDRLLSLSANNSLVDQNSTITHISREQDEAELALTQLRELLAEKEINVYNLRSESKELKDRLLTLESQMKVLETESEARLKKVNELNEKLTEKTQINKRMAAVVEEYERTIASLIADMEQDRKRHDDERAKLITERDEQTAHLASMEVSFSDLHSKYEKSKQIILSCKANEDTYKKSIKEFEENLIKMQNNYELLKQHATSKLNHANQELEKMNKAHESEVLKLNAMIKRKELHLTSLEETLAQKTKANEELTAICDELINKVG